jgi:hypothetical protein
VLRFDDEVVRGWFEGLVLRLDDEVVRGWLEGLVLRFDDEVVRDADWWDEPDRADPPRLTLELDRADRPPPPRLPPPRRCASTSSTEPAGINRPNAR